MTHMSPPDEHRQALPIFLGSLVFLVTLALLGIVIGGALVEHRAGMERALATPSAGAQRSATLSSEGEPVMTMTVIIALPAMMGGAPQTPLPEATLTAWPAQTPSALSMPSSTSTPIVIPTETPTPTPTPTVPILIRPTRARQITPLPLAPTLTPTSVGSRS